MRLLGSFSAGLSAPWLGVQLLLRHRSLRRLLYMPAAILSFLAVLSLWGFWRWLPDWAQAVSTYVWTQMFGWESMPAGFWNWLFVIFSFLVLGLLLIGGFWVVGNLICSLFWELLAEKAAALVRNREVSDLNPDPLLKRLVRSLFREVGKSLVLVFLMGAAWLVTVIPVLGAGVVLFLGPPLVAFWIGYSVIDYTLSSQELPLRFHWGWVKAHWPALIGLGLAGLIPPLLLLFYPAFITGGASLYATHPPTQPN